MKPYAEKRITPLSPNKPFQPVGKQRWRTRFYRSKKRLPYRSWIILVCLAC